MPSVVWYMQQVWTKTPTTPCAGYRDHNGKHKGYAPATAYFDRLQMKASVMFPRVTLGNVI